MHLDAEVEIDITDREFKVGVEFGVRDYDSYPPRSNNYTQLNENDMLICFVFMTDISDTLGMNTEEL